MINIRMFGLGVTDAIAGEKTEGVVTEVKTWWWLKVNTKAVRGGTFDGAQFPHVIHFAYTVGDKRYLGKRFVNWNKRCPEVGEPLTVYYETQNPEKYAVIL